MVGTISFQNAMASSQRNHEFLEGGLYVDGVKFHRGRFCIDSSIQHWDCAQRKIGCTCHAKTFLGKIFLKWINYILFYVL